MEKTASTENKSVNVTNIERSQTKASALDNKLVTFLHIENDFNCVICMQVSDEPVRCNGMCAGIFCDACMKKSLAQSKKCPLCNLKDITAKKDVVVRNQIMKRYVFCINSSNDNDNDNDNDNVNDQNNSSASNSERKASSDMKCTWIGRYDELSTHLKQCEFELTVCSYDECEEKIERRDLDMHLQACMHRTINCDHCMVAVKSSRIEDHLNQCPKIEVLCICQSKFTREKMDEHRDKHCPLTEIECEVIGCNTKVMRKDYLKHQDDAAKKHVRLLSAVVQRLNSAEGPNPSQIKWRLEDIAAKLQEGRFVEKTYRSPTFEVNFHGSIKLYISFNIHGNRVGLYLYKENGNPEILSNKNILNIGGTSFTITKDGLSDKKRIFTDSSILHSDGRGWRKFLADMTPYIENDGINITLNLKLKIIDEPLVLK